MRRVTRCQDGLGLVMVLSRPPEFFGTVDDWPFQMSSRTPDIDNDTRADVRQWIGCIAGALPKTGSRRL